jgi:ankyrin repeat protein
MSTELFEAIEQHDLNRLAALLAGGANPNATQAQGYGWRPLHAAIEELEQGGSIETLVLLLRHDAAGDGWDAAHDATSLLMALFRGQHEAVRMLLAAGADPNVVGGEGDSPLRWSVELGDRETVAMLLRCGADKTIDGAGGASGMTALGRAVSQLNIPMIVLLLDAGADPEALDADRRTARERLPPRETVDPQAWDAAVGLLGR